MANKKLANTASIVILSLLFCNIQCFEGPLGYNRIAKGEAVRYPGTTSGLLSACVLSRVFFRPIYTNVKVGIMFWTGKTDE